MKHNYYDYRNKFAEVFDDETGFYLRTGVLDAQGVDTGVDPFMRNFPALIDIGIMGHCVCAKSCIIDCYQKARDRHGNNMSLDNYKSIMKQSRDRVFQVALGGAGDPDTHENFEDILKVTREYGIVPSFTTSGIAFTDDKAKLCKQYCGAVAVSWHNVDYTYSAIDLLLKNEVKTNIHYVLRKNSIGEAIRRLKENDFPKGINAIIFLTYKDVGLGRIENVLSTEDVKEFFSIIDNNKFDFKIGFDSCAIPGIINFTSNIDRNSIDSCEGGRFSCYIDANMNMMPCSFDNQEMKWALSLGDYSIQQIWDSEKFDNFRAHLSMSCPNCPNKNECKGGCPIRRNIVLCNSKYKELI